MIGQGEYMLKVKGAMKKYWSQLDDLAPTTGMAKRLYHPHHDRML
jgi:hypothetical protein